MGYFKPFYGNNPKFYVDKKAKALAKIDELKKVVEECDKALAEINKNEDK
jgi:hypothetical protein